MHQAQSLPLLAPRPLSLLALLPPALPLASAQQAAGLAWASLPALGELLRAALPWRLAALSLLGLLQLLASLRLQGAAVLQPLVALTWLPAALPLLLAALPLLPLLAPLLLVLPLALEQWAVGLAQATLPGLQLALPLASAQQAAGLARGSLSVLEALLPVAVQQSLAALSLLLLQLLLLLPAPLPL